MSIKDRLSRCCFKSLNQISWFQHVHEIIQQIPDVLVNLIGTFTVKEVTDDYIEMDSWERGTEESVSKYDSSGFIELNSNGSEKYFDGFQKGDFFKFDDGYPIIESNEIFTKIEVEGKELYFPKHKLQEVG